MQSHCSEGRRQDGFDSFPEVKGGSIKEMGCRLSPPHDRTGDGWMPFTRIRILNDNGRVPKAVLTAYLSHGTLLQASAPPMSLLFFGWCIFDLLDDCQGRVGVWSDCFFVRVDTHHGVCRKGQLEDGKERECLTLSNTG